MRRLLLLVALALLPVVAWALSLNVSFRLPPQLNKIKPVAILDEVGNVLFGSKPGKVEVTNLPPLSGGSGTRVVKDATGALIGQVSREDPAGSLFVVRDVGGVQVELRVAQFGFVNTGFPYYETANCSGNAWLNVPNPGTQFFPPNGVVGHTLLFPLDLTVQSISYQSVADGRFDTATCGSRGGTVTDPGPPVICCFSNPQPNPLQVIGPLAAVDLGVFVTPFRIDVQ